VRSIVVGQGRFCSASLRCSAFAMASAVKGMKGVQIHAWKIIYYTILIF
jgi:hypothetical protein